MMKLLFSLSALALLSSPSAHAFRGLIDVRLGKAISTNSNQSSFMGVGIGFLHEFIRNFELGISGSLQTALGSAFTPNVVDAYNALKGQAFYHFYSKRKFDLYAGVEFGNNYLSIDSLSSTHSFTQFTVDPTVGLYSRGFIAEISYLRTSEVENSGIRLSAVVLKIGSSFGDVPSRTKSGTPGNPNEDIQERKRTPLDDLEENKVPI